MKLPATFFENLTQEQSNYVIDILIMYKQLNPNKDVYLNEKTFKSALSVVTNFMAKQQKN